MYEVGSTTALDFEMCKQDSDTHYIVVMTAYCSGRLRYIHERDNSHVLHKPSDKLFPFYAFQ